MKFCSVKNVSVARFARNVENPRAEKVSLNIANGQTVLPDKLLLTGQKIIKNAKNSQFCRAFESPKFAVKQCYQTCQFSQDKKLLENAKNEKFK